jgi:hypothetical protein
MAANLTLVTPYSDRGDRAPVSQGARRVSFPFWRQPVYELSDGSYWTPGIEGPTYLNNVDSPWSYLYIGIPSTQPYTPGKATVHVRKARDTDKKKAAGNDGAHVAIHGVDLSVAEIELLIWTPEQVRALAALWPTLFPQAYKGAPPAYDVQHPLMKYHNIKAMQFIAGEGPEIDTGGRGVFKMTAIEFLKPSKKNTTKTNTAAIGSLLDPSATPTTAAGYATPGSNPANLGPR